MASVVRGLKHGGDWDSYDYVVVVLNLSETAALERLLEDSWDGGSYPQLASLVKEMEVTGRLQG